MVSMNVATGVTSNPANAKRRLFRAIATTPVAQDINRASDPGKCVMELTIVAMEATKRIVAVRSSVCSVRYFRFALFSNIF